MSFSSLPTSRLGTTAVAVSRLGFGAATLGNLYRSMTDANARDAIHAALAAGITYFDTAPYYGFGLSERRLGDALRDQQNCVISTKVGRLLKPCAKARDKHGFCSPMPFEPVYDYSYDAVMRSFEDSLQRLGLSRIDVVFIHDIGRLTHGDANAALFKTAMEGGYKALAELRQQGVIQAIGLGVNETEVCEDAMRYGDFDCFLLAGRYTLLEQGALASFLPKCVAQKVSVIIGGPYNSGILAKGTGSAANLTYNYAPAPADIIAKVAQLEAVCAEFAVPLPAAALQFALAHPAVASVIPGLSSATRVQASLAQFNLPIPREFWRTLLERGLLHEDTPVPNA